MAVASRGGLLWRWPAAGPGRAMRPVCSSGRVEAQTLRAEELAERLRRSEEEEEGKKKKREIPKDPAQRRVRELAALSKWLQQVHPNVLAKVLKQGTVYQNEEIVVINKPYGLPVHGGPGIKNCIADVLPILAKMLENMKAEPLHLCHRLDKETTGVMVLARSKETADRIRFLFKTRQVEKIYWSLVLSPQGNQSGGPRPRRGHCGDSHHGEGGAEPPVALQDDAGPQLPPVSGGWEGGENPQEPQRRKRCDAVPPSGQLFCVLSARAPAHHGGEAPDPGSSGLWLGVPHPGGSQIFTLEQAGTPEAS
ncbi:mitochondrial RNA pseudouridine synthase RPUSD4 isoform X2 [Tyto alba]|uniref:mitochondrial RNA pseudouridine synthase RPUSD4 isoform X2 n=1 Tax=Tyto alba TaxID=56313 RepID=UPI001C66D32B|nr:mitochondrial RNA pseudouridine synthase RPUSD4 isoform X2 [Tyto alba]